MKRLVAGTALALSAAVLAGCSSDTGVTPTGETTTVTVQVDGMHYTPAEIEVPVGDELVVEFENTGLDLHDISFGNGEASERLNPGDTETIEVGVVGEDMEFWCSVSNHREMGMEGMIVV
ncbi:MAG: cupredoxin domain-containing protein, partial [Candidatus Microbacterium stercoravium]